MAPPAPGAPLCEAAAYAGSLSLARSRPVAARRGRGNAAASLGRGPESSARRDSGSSFAGAAAMSALAKASGALKSVDYEVFGRVQGKDGLRAEAAAPRARGCGGPRMRAGAEATASCGASGSGRRLPPRREWKGKKKGCKYFPPAVRPVPFPGEHRLFCGKHFPLPAFMLASSVSAVVWEFPAPIWQAKF